jgi:hypothetical protein
MVPRSSTRGVTILEVVFGLIGVGFLLTAGMLTVNTIRFMASAVEAPGTVIGHATHRSSKGNTLYSPRVEFIGPDGTTSTFEADFANSQRLYDVGDAVRVLFPPGRPAEARIGEGLSLWFAPFVAAFIGATSLAVGVGSWLAHRASLRRRPRAREDATGRLR